MDTSPEYIKQCEKAGEIQKAWEPTAWDWVYCRPAGKEGQNPVVLSDYEVDGGYYGHSVKPECSSPISNGAYRTGNRNFREEHFFIPRQDQLQEMVGGFGQARIAWNEWLEHTYASLGYGNPIDTSRRFNSFEQEWLAFAMHEKYGKIWDSQKEEWVKED